MIIPCLWVSHDAEGAAALYTRAFPKSRVLSTSHYPMSFDAPGGQPRGAPLTIELELSGHRFTLLNGGPQFRPNQTISFFVYVDSPAEADTRFAALAEGGQVMMPLDTYPWSERYAWVADRFGVSWQIISGRRPAGSAVIAPCFMFSDAQQGRAEEAINTWSRVFPNSRALDLERYQAGEGPVGSVKHGRFQLSGQHMVAMDSHVAHQVSFTEGVSLQVRCEDRAELDRCWAALGDGGHFGPCGWLKDRFGLSWQVVPTALARWMSDADPVARDRAFKVMLEMGKLDLAQLERAYAGA
jgi:predicted 3-demethylubiquinone-9 3-methyltransferase (glyoxalase superfamily)